VIQNSSCTCSKAITLFLQQTKPFFKWATGERIVSGRSSFIHSFNLKKRNIFLFTLSLNQLRCDKISSHEYGAQFTKKRIHLESLEFQKNIMLHVYRCVDKNNFFIPNTLEYIYIGVNILNHLNHLSASEHHHHHHRHTNHIIILLLRWIWLDSPVFLPSHKYG